MMLLSLVDYATSVVSQLVPVVNMPLPKALTMIFGWDPHLTEIMFHGRSSITIGTGNGTTEMVTSVTKVSIRWTSRVGD